jgi:drug/metabolite transporter (DMT)-like permease
VATYSMAPAVRTRALGFSLAGALSSALYLFPYKRASAFAPPRALAWGLLLMAALGSGALSLVPRAIASRAVPATDPLQSRRFWGTALLFALLTISGNFCGAQAVGKLEPAINSVLLRTEVAFVGALGALFLGETLTFGWVLGAAGALLGLVILNWPLTVRSASGAVWALGAAASFGSMQIVVRAVAGRVDLQRLNSARLWLATGALALVPNTVNRAWVAGREFWLLVGLAALFGPFLGRLCIMRSLVGLRAAESALLLLLAPVFAFAFGYLLDGSLPSATQGAGAALMLCGIGLPLARRRSA